jgi:hypothetical protein
MPENDATAHAINNLSAVLGSINVNLVELRKSLDRMIEKLSDQSSPTAKRS